MFLIADADPLNSPLVIGSAVIALAAILGTGAKLVHGLGELRSGLKGVVREVVNEVRAEEADRADSKLPQPLIVKPHESVVGGTAFNIHLDSNRRAHADLWNAVRATGDNLHKELAATETRIGEAGERRMGKLSEDLHNMAAILGEVRGDRKSVV